MYGDWDSFETSKFQISDSPRDNSSSTFFFYFSHQKNRIFIFVRKKERNMFGRRLLTVAKVTQQAYRGMAMKAEVTPAVRRKNIAVAITIVCFVGGVYYHSINKMKQVSHSFTIFLYLMVVLTFSMIYDTGRVRQSGTGGLGRTQKQGVNHQLTCFLLDS